METFLGAFLLSAALVSLVHGPHGDSERLENTIQQKTLTDPAETHPPHQTSEGNSTSISASSSDTPQDNNIPVPESADAIPTVHCQPQGPVYRTLVLPYQE